MDMLEHGKGDPGDPRDPRDPATPAGSRSRGRTVGIVIAVVAVGLLGAGGVSYAAAGKGAPTQTSPSATPTPSASPSAKPSTGPEKGKDHRGFPGRGPGFGMGGFGGGALHGEFTVKKRDGGYQTVAMQRGSVTAVSSSSITVKSEDGFSRTYVVTSSTIVRATREGIAAVKTGHQVNVSATVSGSTATATNIGDQSLIKPR